uniref:F-box domain-containing protein n=1 Tax=Romanomermis culicivorax TaxID=13658 RepID=A0A915L087_ROMCU
MDEIPIFHDSPDRLPRNKEIQFISFPDEIIEIIFAFLPIHDILCSLTRVCRRFNALISGEKFLKYKKLYYRYNAGNRSFTDKERISIDLAIVDHEKFFDPEKCLENFIFLETIKDFKHLNEEVSNQILQRIGLSENLAICRRFFDKNAPQKPSAWSYIAGCILVSENVDQITKLLKVLNVPHQIASKTCVQGQNLTHEQLRVVKHDLMIGNCMKIIALAGTGKTRTLIEYARVRPHLKFLVIFYNWALALDASERFPKNCICLTIHAIAKRNVSVKHLENNIYVTHLSKIKNLRASVKGIPYYSTLNLVKETLRTFFNSSEESITIHHCPQAVRLKDKTVDGSMKSVRLLYEQQRVIRETAQRVWDKIQNVDDKEIPMFHDAYLKRGALRAASIFQLSKPDFRVLYPDIDVIMVDEAQDMNPTTIAIIKNQKYHPVIVVGDPHQQIYRFRGSCNALDVFPGPDVPCHNCHY